MCGRLRVAAVFLMYEATLSLVEPSLMLSLFGARDQHLRAVRDALGVRITHRDGQIHVCGEEQAVARATEVLEQLKALAERKGSLADGDVASMIGHVTGRGSPALEEVIDVIDASRTIRPRTVGQAGYVAKIRRHDVVLAAGPAGSAMP